MLIVLKGDSNMFASNARAIRQIIVIAIFILIGYLSQVYAADNNTSSKSGTIAASKARTKTASSKPHQLDSAKPHQLNSAPSAEARAQAAEARAQAAEARSQAAEAAAAKASSDAKAAQDLAAEALKTAQQLREELIKLQTQVGQIKQPQEKIPDNVVAAKNAQDFMVDAGPSPAVREIIKNSRAAQAGDPIGEELKRLPQFYGLILLNSNYLDRGSNNNDAPFFALRADSAKDQNHQNYNMTLRQTRFGVNYKKKIFKDADLTGVVEIDFFDGKPALSTGISFDIVRLRLAYGRIAWKNDALELGQDNTIFSPLNPTTLASFAAAGFTSSGNLFNRIPQIRYEHSENIGKVSQLTVAAALLDPNAGDNAGNTAARLVGLGERGSLPAFESRIAFTTLQAGKSSSIGVSAHYSRLIAEPNNPTNAMMRSPIDSYGVCGDYNIWLTSGLRITGEAFHGRALGIFGGGILQSAVVINGRAIGINSTGGWTELHAEAPANYIGIWKNFSANIGYGVEDNRSRDLLVGLRKLNQTYMINGRYNFSNNFSFAIEYRQIQTDYFRQAFANQKLNWADIAFLYTF
jgi:hypothetical protein